MSGTKKAATTEVAKTSDVTIQSTGEILSAEQLMNQMQGKKKGMEVTSEYYEFPAGEPKRVCYIGDATIKGQKGEDVPAVRIFLEDGAQAITASAVVVSTLKQYEKGAMFEITRTGERKSGSGGTYYTYEIFELN